MDSNNVLGDITPSTSTRRLSRCSSVSKRSSTETNMGFHTPAKKENAASLSNRAPRGSLTTPGIRRTKSQLLPSSRRLSVRTNSSALKSSTRLRVSDASSSTVTMLSPSSKSSNSVRRKSSFKSQQQQPILDGEAVRVLVRVRPPTNDQVVHVDEDTYSVGTISYSKSVRNVLSIGNLKDGTGGGTQQTFTFDRVFGPESQQEEIFSEVGKPITEVAVQGYNASIFAYGQTGSGKTFTMEGSREDEEQEGLIPRVLGQLFSSLDNKRDASGSKYRIHCSYTEIYNEYVYDLLDPPSATPSVGASSLKRKLIREDTRTGVFVEGLVKRHIRTPQEAFTVLDEGSSQRHVAETKMNHASSRSHSIFSLYIETSERLSGEDSLEVTKFARINLVDLAGSERQQRTQSQGDRLQEAKHINKSLSALGNVISALVDRSEGRSRHIPHRNSALTYLLKDSLGGNTKTAIVATVSPDDSNFQDTLSTLKFGQRAKAIKNVVEINTDISGSLDAYKREVQMLTARLAYYIQKDKMAFALRHGGGHTKNDAPELQGGETNDMLVSATEAASVVEDEEQSDKSAMPKPPPLNHQPKSPRQTHTYVHGNDNFKRISATVFEGEHDKQALWDEKSSGNEILRSRLTHMERVLAHLLHELDASREGLLTKDRLMKQCSDANKVLSESIKSKQLVVDQMKILSPRSGAATTAMTVGSTVDKLDDGNGSAKRAPYSENESSSNATFDGSATNSTPSEPSEAQTASTKVTVDVTTGISDTANASAVTAPKPIGTDETKVALLSAENAQLKFLMNHYCLPYEMLLSKSIDTTGHGSSHATVKKHIMYELKRQHKANVALMYQLDAIVEDKSELELMVKQLSDQIIKQSKKYDRAIFELQRAARLAKKQIQEEQEARTDDDDDDETESDRTILKLRRQVESLENELFAVQESKAKMKSKYNKFKASLDTKRKQRTGSLRYSLGDEHPDSIMAIGQKEGGNTLLADCPSSESLALFSDDDDVCAMKTPGKVKDRRNTLAVMHSEGKDRDQVTRALIGVNLEIQRSSKKAEQPSALVVQSPTSDEGSSSDSDASNSPVADTLEQSRNKIYALQLQNEQLNMQVETLKQKVHSERRKSRRSMSTAQMNSTKDQIIISQAEEEIRSLRTNNEKLLDDNKDLRETVDNATKFAEFNKSKYVSCKSELATLRAKLKKTQQELQTAMGTIRTLDKCDTEKRKSSIQAIFAGDKGGPSTALKPGASQPPTGESAQPRSPVGVAIVSAVATSTPLPITKSGQDVDPVTIMKTVSSPAAGSMTAPRRLLKKGLLGKSLAGSSSAHSAEPIRHAASFRVRQSSIADLFPCDGGETSLAKKNAKAYLDGLDQGEEQQGVAPRAKVVARRLSMSGLGRRSSSTEAEKGEPKPKSSRWNLLKFGK